MVQLFGLGQRREGSALQVSDLLVAYEAQLGTNT